MQSDSSKLVVRDNRKPVFTRCGQYHASVKEEQEYGTPVLTVHAVDKDPPDAGGSVEYAFVAAPGERLKFHIDPQTGNITTRHVSHFLKMYSLELLQ